MNLGLLKIPIVFLRKPDPPYQRSQALEIAVGAVFALTRFSLLRVSIRDLVPQLQMQTYIFRAKKDRYNKRCASVREHGCFMLAGKRSSSDMPGCHKRSSNKATASISGE